MFFRPLAIILTCFLALSLTFRARADDSKSEPGTHAPRVHEKPLTHSSASAADGYDPDLVDGIISASVDTLWDKTDYYWHAGDFQRIIALDRIIVELDPRFMEPYSTGGWLMESAGDNVNAEKFYRLGAACHSDSSYMYYQLGMFYFNTVKNYKGALQAAQTGTKQSDAGVNDWRLLAHSYEECGMLAESVDTWKHIQKVYPNEGATLHNLARVQQLLDKKLHPSTTAPVDPKSSTPANPVISL